MIPPLTRRGQARIAVELETALNAGNSRTREPAKDSNCGGGGEYSPGRLPILHVVTFPRLTINHVLVLFGVSTTPAGLEFQCYDPNICEKPLLLTYEQAGRTFIYPRTHYFPGGQVNVYEIYRGLFL